MAIEMDGMKFDTIEEFNEFFDSQVERGLAKLNEHTQDVEKYKRYLEDKKADEDKEEIVVVSKEEVENDIETFSVGDRAILKKVILTTAGFEVGDEVIVEDTKDPGIRPLRISQLTGGSIGFVSPEHLEKVEILGYDATGEPLYKGDLVTGIEGNDYSITDENSLCEVYCGNSVLIVEGTNEFGRDMSGESYWVSLDQFIKTTKDEFHDNQDETPQELLEKGTKVVIVGNGGGHLFNTGDVGIITEVDEDGDDNLPYLVQSGARSVWVTADDVEVYEEDLLTENTKVIVHTSNRDNQLQDGHEYLIDKVDPTCHRGLVYKLKTLDGSKFLFEGWVTKEEVEEVKPDVDTTEFEVGDMVSVLRETDDCGYYHGFKVGDIGEIVDISTESRNDGVSTPYCVEVHGRTASQDLHGYDLSKLTEGTKVKFKKTHTDKYGDMVTEGSIGRIDENIINGIYFVNIPERDITKQRMPKEEISEHLVSISQDSKLVKDLTFGQMCDTVDEEDEEPKEKVGDGDVVFVNESFEDPEGLIVERGFTEIKSGLLFGLFVRRMGQSKMGDFEGNEDKLTLVVKAEDRLDK